MAQHPRKEHNVFGFIVKSAIMILEKMSKPKQMCVCCLHILIHSWYKVNCNYDTNPDI